MAALPSWPTSRHWRKPAWKPLCPTPRNAKRDRYAPLPGDPPEVATWRERMNTDDAKAIDKKRASTVECANAQARNLTRFLVRGLEAVTATALWHALAQNMFCTWRLVAA